MDGANSRPNMSSSEPTPPVALVAGSFEDAVPRSTLRRRGGEVMNESKIEVPTADGMAEAYLFTPSRGSGPWPGVIFLTDIMGIRKANLGMARRIAEHGYVVLVPNIFYRVSRLPVVDFELKMGDERTMKRMGELRAGLSNAQMGPDGAAYVDF